MACAQFTHLHDAVPDHANFVTHATDLQRACKVAAQSWTHTMSFLGICVMCNGAGNKQKHGLRCKCAMQTVRHAAHLRTLHYYGLFLIVTINKSVSWWCFRHCNTHRRLTVHAMWMGIRVRMRMQMGRRVRMRTGMRVRMGRRRMR